MNIKNNARRKKSVEKIENAFTELILEKELNEIKVSEICKICGINRSTFYANFDDIYDLADNVAERLEGSVSVLYEAEQIQSFNSNDYLRLFRHIKENQPLYKTYFKLGYDKLNKKRLYDVHQAVRDFNNEHIDYHLEFFKSGFNGIVKKWLLDCCKETPEEMEKIIISEYMGRVN